MRELLALYEEVVRALDAAELAGAAAARAPRPAPGGRLVILGLGKVAAELYEGARGEGDALLVVPRAAPAPAGAKVLRGGHPLPDAGSLAAGEALLQAADGLGPLDAALLLISGGGSALAEAPHADLSLEEVRAVNQALLNSGAPIEEMNCVRSHLSRLKGGGLARALHARGVTRARALVAVDVPIGGARAVSSGPAIADTTSCADALGLVRKHALPAAATRVRETLKPGEPADFIEHEALCDLRSPALEAARRRGLRMLESPVRGTVEAFAETLAKERGFVCASGELEVRLPAGAQPGGRDQHLALLMARILRGERGAAFLAAGTDGRDGPTAAAGAMVDGSTWDEAERRGLQPARALAEFDATRVLSALGLLIPERHTGAHAGDLYLLQR
jgi:hydroxypyruvate reductase